MTEYTKGLKVGIGLSALFASLSDLAYAWSNNFQNLDFAQLALFTCLGCAFPAAFSLLYGGEKGRPYGLGMSTPFIITATGVVGIFAHNLIN